MQIIKDIFVVEDDALIAMLLESMLEEIGYAVTATAGDLQEALVKVETERFDAAILDVSLAGQSALSIAQRLDALGKPYIFATGYGLAPEGAAGSGHPILRKPFQVADLQRAMDNLAELSELPAQRT